MGVAEYSHHMDFLREEPRPFLEDFDMYRSKAFEAAIVGYSANPVQELDQKSIYYNLLIRFPWTSSALKQNFL
ncbi:MAG: hypothetical protein ABJP58_00225 [Parasphingorhabdus sp.]